MADLTEEEDSDGAELTLTRRGRKTQLLREVKEEMKQKNPKGASHYQPDERSKKWAKEFFIHPLLKGTHSYRNLSQEEWQDRVKRGIFSKKMGKLPETSFTYHCYLKKVLGQIQAMELEKDQNLQDGLLQVWQFASYKTDSFFRLPSVKTFEDNIISRFESGPTKKPGHLTSNSSELCKISLDLMKHGPTSKTPGRQSRKT